MAVACLTIERGGFKYRYLHSKLHLETPEKALAMLNMTVSVPNAAISGSPNTCLGIISPHLPSEATAVILQVWAETPFPCSSGSQRGSTTTRHLLLINLVLVLVLNS